MIYTLKQYQRNAVDELKEEILNKFNSINTKKTKSIVFKAPTGSGKTFMVASLIEELAEEYSDLDFCVIWASIGKGELQKQSYESVKSYLGGNPTCSLIEESFFGYRSYIKNHEIVFVNWEKLISKDKETGEWINNIMKDQEGQNFIDVIENTRKRMTNIILVVDESHIGANSKSRIAEFKDVIIMPNITLEMSATPLTEPDVSIDAQDVINEGMIKEDVIVNEGIKKEDVSNANKDSEMLILEKAEEKRLELLNEYNQIGSKVNPLVLVQIPNVAEGEAKKIVVKDFLRKHGITEENGKVKLWCDDKGDFDKKAIKRIDDVTEYLIFKTAVATGWDCPRAQILVKFREGKSETFEIQTIGRILRTAEAKSYGNILLDNAYIFTNIDSFETKQDTYSPNRIKTEFSYFKNGYDKKTIWEETQLKSFYRSREGNYNSADSRFSSYFEKEFMDYFGFKEDDKNVFYTTNAAIFEKSGFDLSLLTADTLMEETRVEAYTIDKAQLIISDTASVRMSENDIQASYYSIIKSNLNGLAYVRSKSPINSAVVDVFGKFYNAFPRSEKIQNTQRIMVNNKEIFAEIILNSTQKFREMLQETAFNKGVTYDFKIEDKKGFSTETHKELYSSKSLYQPLFVLMDKSSGQINYLEKDFIRYLDSSQCVRWFWENGPELMEINFGIPYNNGLSTFQPDFIVKFEDGTVGIFDTKGVGQRVEDTKLKAEALYNYILSINMNRGYAPKIIGGIVIKKGSEFYYYNENVYHDYDDDSTKWKSFTKIFFEVSENCKVKNK